MPQSARQYQDPRVSLSELRDRQTIDEELFHSLSLLLNCSATGRAFGHKSALELSGLIGDLCKQCSQLEASNQDSARSIFNRVLSDVKKPRSRKITPVNAMLREVANELDCLGREPAASCESPSQVDVGRLTLKARFVRFLLG